MLLSFSISSPRTWERLFQVCLGQLFWDKSNGQWESEEALPVSRSWGLLDVSVYNRLPMSSLTVWPLSASGPIFKNQLWRPESRHSNSCSTRAVIQSCSPLMCLGRKQMTVQVLWLPTHMWETQRELLAPGFGLATAEAVEAMRGSKLENGKLTLLHALSPSVSHYLCCFLIKQISR